MPDSTLTPSASLPTLNVRHAGAEDRPVLERLWLLFRHDLSQVTGDLPRADGTFRSERLDAALRVRDGPRSWRAAGTHRWASPLHRSLEREPFILNSFFVVAAARGTGVSAAFGARGGGHVPGDVGGGVPRGQQRRNALLAKVAAAHSPHWTEERRVVPGRPHLPRDTWITFRRAWTGSWPGPNAMTARDSVQPRAEYQSSTRRARRVFHRLGRPTLSSSWTGMAPGWRVSSAHRPSSSRLDATHVDRLGHPLVGRDAGAPQVLQPAQHVVVPPRREGQAGPVGAVRAITLDHLAGGPPSEESAREKVLLPAQTRVGDLGSVAPQPFPLEKGLQHADRGVEGRPRRAVLRLAVPAAVGQLLAEQPLDDATDVLSEVGAGRATCPLMQGSTSPSKKALPSHSSGPAPRHVTLSRTRSTARRAGSLAGSKPSSRSSSRRTCMVESHPRFHAVPAHSPPGPCMSRSRAPTPSVATRARSAATSCSGARPDLAAPASGSTGRNRAATPSPTVRRRPSVFRWIDAHLPVLVLGPTGRCGRRCARG